MTKIVSIEAIPVILPFHDEFQDSLGTYRCSHHGIVVARSESGHYGAGEIALAWFGGAHSLCREVNELWAPRLVGEEITDLAKIMAMLDEWSAFSRRHLLAKAGVEIALLDLIGKIAGLPVYRLLGGKMRSHIELTGGIAIDTVDRMVRSAERKAAEGYKELKIKVGLDERGDLEAVRKIRHAIPDRVKLRVDANMAWNEPKQAKRLIDEMAQYGVTIVEQPLPAEQLDDLRWLRNHTAALILLDESVWDANDAKRCLDAGSADLLHVYVSEAGGLHAARKIFELSSLYRVDCTIGSMPEGRIGAAASLHLGISMPNLSGHASDIRGFTLYREDVAAEELAISDGKLFVGERPGLGITLDLEKLEKLRVR